MSFESGRSMAAGISHGEYRKSPVSRKQRIADRIEAQKTIDEALTPVRDDQHVNADSILDRIGVSTRTFGRS